MVRTLVATVAPDDSIAKTFLFRRMNTMLMRSQSGEISEGHFPITIHSPETILP